MRMLEKITEIIYHKTGVNIPKSTVVMLLILIILIIILIGSFMYRASVLGIGSIIETEIFTEEETLY